MREKRWGRVRRGKVNMAQTDRDSKQRQSSKLFTLNIPSRRLWKHQAKIREHALLGEIKLLKIVQEIVLLWDKSSRLRCYGRFCRPHNISISSRNTKKNHNSTLLVVADVHFFRAFLVWKDKVCYIINFELNHCDVDYSVFVLLSGEWT